MQLSRLFYIVFFVTLILMTAVYAGDLNEDLINAAKKGHTKAVKS